MKKLSIFFLLFLISSTAFADKFLVEKKDGSVVIWNYVDDPSLMDQKAKDLGYEGLTIVPITDKDFPPDDQKYWRMNHIPIGSKILIDLTAEQADKDAQVLQDKNKNDVLTKLGITVSEFSTLVKAAIEDLNK